MEKIDKENYLQLLKYTKEDDKSYNGNLYDVGYHTVELGSFRFKGQRDCNERLKDIPYNFQNKNVLDIGCNQGGMLFNLQEKIKSGIGIDYNPKMINVCNKYRNIQKIDNLDFYNFDLDNEKINNVSLFLRPSGCDIVFLLSVCMWIKKWTQVIDFSSEIAPSLLFETNGQSSQQDDQVHYLDKRFKKIKLIREQSTDDPVQKNRKLFLCQN